MLPNKSGDPARSRYILMKRITAPRRENRIVRKGVMSDRLNTVSEVCVMESLNKMEKHFCTCNFFLLKEATYD